MPIQAGISRRIAERAIAAAALLVTLPLILLCAGVSAAIYRTSPFFVHERVGFGGQRFHFYKIRTLPPTTNRYADKYALGDATVPASMQLVRRLHLDELPQLLHVVRGQMSLVGPRPEMPCLHDSLPRDFAQLRTSVRPGLTCLWQISPHNRGLISERSEYDRLYVDYSNPLLDLWILSQTAKKMTTGSTIHLHEIPRWVIREPRPSAGREVPAERAWHSPAVPEPARTSA